MESELQNNVGYRKLIVWQKAHQLVLLIYQITLQFPKSEIFGLSSQMQRSAVSVPANIVEGYARKSTKEKLHFYNIAKGSLSELEYFIDLAFDLGYIDSDVHHKLVDMRGELGKVLYGFIKSV